MKTRVIQDEPEPQVPAAHGKAVAGRQPDSPAAPTAGDEPNATPDQKGAKS